MKKDQPWKGLRFVLFPWLFKRRVFEYSIMRTVLYIGEPMLSRAEMLNRFEEIPPDLEPYRKGLDPVTQLELERFTVRPELPYGLNLNIETGTIDGIPSEPAASTTYMIEARQKKKRYRSLVRIEVRSHTVLPAKDDLELSDYVEAPDSTYTAAGITRNGHPLLTSKGKELAPPRTRRQKKKARKTAQRQRTQEEKEENRRQKQRKIEAKRQRQQDKKNAKSQKKASKRRKGTPPSSDTRDAPSPPRDVEPTPLDAAPQREPRSPTPAAPQTVDLQPTRTEEPARAEPVEALAPADEPVKKPDAPRVKGTQVALSIGSVEVEFDDATALPETGNAWLGHPERGVRISWTGKSGNTLTGVEGVKRKVPAGAVFREGTLQSGSGPEVAEHQPAHTPDHPLPATETEEAPVALSRKERRRLKKERNQDEPTEEPAPDHPQEVRQTTSAPDATYQKGATSLDLDDASHLPSVGGAWIGGAERGVHITWTGKSGNTLTGVSGLRKSVSKNANFVLDEHHDEPEAVEEAPTNRPKF